jgi:hypothetical protein
MKDKTLPVRRKFANEWDEIGYLYDRLLFWLYQRQDMRQARRYAKRLPRLLQSADPKHQAILGEECWSLIYEAQGDLQKAIECRENEVRLIRRLQEISRDATYRDFVLEDYDLEALRDRLDLLAVLYHDDGNLGKALQILEESRRLCAEHKVKFDGKDLLREYQAEKRDQGEAAGETSVNRKRAATGSTPHSGRQK